MRTPPVVLDAMHATFLARAMFVVAELGIADVLAEGPLSCADLAARVGVERDPLHQVLRAVATTGLLRTEPGPETGPHQRFALTETGRTLQDEHPSGTRDLVLTMQGELFWNALRVLPQRVAEGRTGPEIACGKPFFDLMSERPDEAARFNRMMVATNCGEASAVAGAYDFSAFERLVDVGGGIGTVLLEVLREHPRLRGVLLDLPGVTEQARRTIAEAGLSARCEVVEGDFLAALPSGADAYLVSRVLHDWDDETCVRVLRSCARAMTGDSRLLLVEKVLPDDDEPHLGKRLDLVMVTLTRGRERTAAEYGALLAEAGLRTIRHVPTGTAAGIVEAALAS
ncbi:methyltransferase [Saccharopolyspora tripterygii]